MDLALNNLQMLICHKTQQINQPTNQIKIIHIPAKFVIIKNIKRNIFLTQIDI